MGVYNTNRADMRVPRTDQEIREARDHDARVVVAGRALKRPDTEEFLLDILACLGLDGDTSCPPSPVRLMPPDEISAPIVRDKTADVYPQPDAATHAEPEAPRYFGDWPRQKNHGKPGGYMSHRRRGERPCDACRLAYNRDQNDRAARARQTGRIDPKGTS